MKLKIIYTYNILYTFIYKSNNNIFRASVDVVSFCRQYLSIVAVGKHTLDFLAVGEEINTMYVTCMAINCTAYVYTVYALISPSVCT